MKVFNGRIGKRERYCGHDHKTAAAARRCGEKQAGKSLENAEIVKVTRST
jgi:hypothetical protein